VLKSVLCTLNEKKKEKTGQPFYIFDDDLGNKYIEKSHLPDIEEAPCYHLLRSRK